MKLFSYVVDHDLGFAPNPHSGYCTLVHCKFSPPGHRRNIVELADTGDWILGTGGSGKQSAGKGKLVYLMRVDEKLAFDRFLADRRFQGRSDCEDFGNDNRFALISERFFYFGKNALSISCLPHSLAAHLTKTGPGFRSDLPEDKIMDLIERISRHYKVGIHGDPCATADASLKVRLRAQSC
jgi:hypothetical protein